MGPPQRELAVTITEAVSEALKTPIEELPLLTRTIDPEAVARAVTTDPAADVTVTFTYAGTEVFVRSGHTVYVQPTDRHGENRTDASFAGQR